MAQNVGNAGITPRIGFVAMSLPGFLLGEEMTPAKSAECIQALKDRGYEILEAECVYSQEDAKRIGKTFSKEDVDCICVLLTTFIADYFITELVKTCDKPVFLWALEREVHCLATVCTPLIAVSLKNLKKDCCVVSGDVDDDFVYEKLFSYSRAAMLKNRLRDTVIGYIGHKPSIMFSMESDEYLLDNNFGVTVKPIPIEDFYNAAEKIDPILTEKTWAQIRCKVGCSNVREEDAWESVKFYLAAKQIVTEHGLAGFSINCFPHLKARICLAVALLNDDGIGAGCEGDLNSTILMVIATMLNGQAPFNGDFLRTYRETNSIMFSHCGAGAFSLAGCKNDICLKRSAETDNGLAVFYVTDPRGPVTMLNMVLGKGNMRITSLFGEGVQDDSGYEGTPLRVKFAGDIKDMPDQVAQRGAGHHWVGIHGDWTEVFRLLARMNTLDYEQLKPIKA